MKWDIYVEIMDCNIRHEHEPHSYMREEKEK